MTNNKQELTQVIHSLGLMVRALAGQVKSLHGRNEEKDQQLTDTAGELADAVARCELLLQQLFAEQDRRNELVTRLQMEIALTTQMWQKAEARRDLELEQDREHALRWREHIANERADAEQVYYEQQDIAELWEPIQPIYDTRECPDCLGEHLVPGRNGLFNCN